MVLGFQLNKLETLNTSRGETSRGQTDKGAKHRVNGVCIMVYVSFRFPSCRIWIDHLPSLDQGVLMSLGMCMQRVTSVLLFNAHFRLILAICNKNGLFTREKEVVRATDVCIYIYCSGYRTGHGC